MARWFPNRVPLSEYRSGKGKLGPRSDIQERYRQAVSEIAALGKMTETQLRTLLLDPARGYNTGEGKAYHWTTVQNLGRVLRQGIQPRANVNPTRFSEDAWIHNRIPQSVAKRQPRVFVELAAKEPRGHNLPLFLKEQKLLGRVDFSVEEALKRLAKEDALRILAIEIARAAKYPLEHNGVSRRIILNKTGMDVQAGANPARDKKTQLMDIPEWALSERVPSSLLGRPHIIRQRGFR